MTKAAFKTFCDGLALYASRFVSQADIDMCIKNREDRQLTRYCIALDFLNKAWVGGPWAEASPACKIIPFTPALYRKADRQRMLKEFYE